MQPSMFSSNSDGPQQTGSAFTTLGSQRPQSGSTFFGTQLESQSSSVFGGGKSVRSLFGGVSAESNFSPTHPEASTVQSSISFGNPQSGSVFGGMTSTGSLFGKASSESAQSSVFGSTFGSGQTGSTFGSGQTGSIFGSSQAGSTFGISQPGSTFGSSQPGPTFDISQPGSTFGSSQPRLSFGSSQPGSIFGSSQPGSTFGSSQPGSTFGSSQPVSTFGSSQPGSTFGSSQPGSAFGSSQPGSTFGSSQPVSTFGSSQPVSTFGSSQPGLFFGSSQTSSMFGSSQLGSTFGSSQPDLSFGSSQTGLTFGSSQPGLSFNSGQLSSTSGSDQPVRSFSTSQLGPSFASPQSGKPFGISQSSSVFSSMQPNVSFSHDQPKGSFFGSSGQSGTIFGSTLSGPSFDTTKTSSIFGGTQLDSSFGSAQPGTVFGSTQPGTSFGSTQSGTLFGSTQPGTSLGSTQVGTSSGSTQVGTSFNSTEPDTSFGSTQSSTFFGSKPGTSFGSTQPGTSFGSAQLGTSFGSTQPGTFFDSTQPGTSFGSTEQGTSFGNTQPSTIFGNTQSGPSFNTTQSSSIFSSTQPGIAVSYNTSGSSFGSTQPGSLFTSTQPTTSFGSTQPGTSVGNTQQGTSFFNTQLGTAFGSTQSGTSVGSSQPVTLFGSSQPDTSFGSTQPGTLFTSSHSATSFGINQAGTSLGTQLGTAFGSSQPSTSLGTQLGTAFGSSQPSTSLGTQLGTAFGSSQPSTSLGTQLGTAFGSSQPSTSFPNAASQCSFDLFPSNSNSISNEKENVFGNACPESSTDSTKSIGNFSGSLSSAANVVGTAFSKQVVSSIDEQSKQNIFLEGMQSKSSSHPHPLSFSDRSPEKFSQKSLSHQASSLFLGQGAHASSIFGNQNVQTSLQNMQSSSSGFSTFSSTVSQSSPPSQSNMRKRSAQDVHSSDQLFGKPTPTGSFPNLNTSTKSCNSIDSSEMAHTSKVASQTQDLATGRGLFSFGSSIQPANLIGKSSESKLTRTASSFNLESQNKTDNKDDAQGVSPSKTKMLQKESSPQKKSKISAWSRALSISDSRKRSSSLSDRENRENKRSCLADDKSPPQLSLGRNSLDEMSSKTCLVVKEIPAQLNKGTTLRNHFSKFGTVTKLLPILSKRMAYVTFETHEQAELAKKEGKLLGSKGPAVSIFWRSNSTIKTPEIRKSKENLFMQPSKKSSFGSMVEDELSSMAETCDFEGEMFTQSSAKRKKLRGTRRRSPTPPPVVSVLAQSVPDVDNVKELLKKLISTRAKDSSGRIELLDARDKLLRILRGRQQSDLASAKAFYGTCPDMCPEKERYYREDIRRLALYEVLQGTLTSITGQKSKVDHSRAVKEYSRSSADQEEPLPHELRPLPVLVLTMNYLLSQVADQGGDGQWSEWYDFLWNRTRGIRKDITQQQLNDVQVAELLEKCARFHIFCSERLCEEDMMTFDTKINNENLTKCLQTLKEIYADLEKKQTFCPNEAEFRGYMVLMNLNEGDTMRDIQQLRQEIRDSEPIHFAVKAYNAVNANNYVRFFRIIKEASFLNACILHRYFNQIRGKALVITMRAFNAINKNKVMYPIQELTRLLCFENDDEAKEFCNNYCLSVEENYLVMDSKAYMEPESSLPLRRSPSLVETKRKISVGEAINGSPLPKCIIPTPSCSFDHEGQFIMTSDIQEALATSGLFGSRFALPEASEMQSSDETSQSLAQPAAARATALRITADMTKEKLIAYNDVVKSLARSLILEVIDSNVLDIASEETTVHAGLVEEVQCIIDDVTTQIISLLCKEVLEEEELILRKTLAEQSIKLNDKLSSLVTDDLITNTVDNLIKDIVVEEMEAVKTELLKQSRERSCIVWSEDLLNKVVADLIADISQDVYQVDVVAKYERLEATAKCVQLITCRKFFWCWRSMYLSKIKVKRAMLDFPSAPPPTVSASAQIDQLLSARKDRRIAQKSFYVGSRAKLSIAPPMEIIQQQLDLTTQLTMASARKMLNSLLMWKPLDLSSVLGPPLNAIFQSWLAEELVDPDTFQPEWKLHLSLPDKQSTDVQEFHRWITAKLCKNTDREEILETVPNYEGQVLTLYQIIEPKLKTAGMPLRICIRSFRGNWTDTQEINVEKKDLLKGTTAVLFLTSTAEELLSGNSQAMAWKNDKQRLHQLLKQKRASPALPLVIVIPRLLEENVVRMSMVDNGLELTSLYKQKLINSVHLAEPVVGTQEQHLDNYQQWISQLTNCLKFTISNMPVSPKLRAKPVSDLVEDAVVEFYKAPVFQDLRTRNKFQKLHQSPNTLLTLYNAVIEHVSMVTASSTLCKISWPAPEFNQSLNTFRSYVPSSWNSEEHMCNLYELVGKLRLPYFHYTDMEAYDWSSVCQDVWKYINALTKKDSGSAKLCLFQQVSELLSRTKKNFDQFCWLAEECGPCEPTYVNMAWTDLIDACIHYRLVSLRTGHVTLRQPEKELEEGEEEKMSELDDYMEPTVYYLETQLEDWQAPQVWLDAMRETEQSETGQLKTTILKAKSLKADSPVEEPRIALSATHNLTQSSPKTSSAGWETFKDQFEQERLMADQFEKNLESILTSPCHPILASSFVPYVSPIQSVGQQLSRTSRGQEPVTPSRKKYEDWLKDRQAPLSAPSSNMIQTYQKTVVQDKTSQSQLGRIDLSAILNDQLSTPILSDQMTELQALLQSEREAEVLFELHLKKLLNQ